MDQLTSMRTFAMIASQRSFIRAAEKLNLAPSVISKQLSALEKHLGILLVERTTRVVKLTEVGELYLARCKHILAEVDDTEAMITTDNWEYPYTREKAAFPVSYLKGGGKFWPTIGRVNNVYGDRNLICTCPPMEDYMEA